MNHVLPVATLTSALASACAGDGTGLVTQPVAAVLDCRTTTPLSQPSEWGSDQELRQLVSTSARAWARHPCLGGRWGLAPVDVSRGTLGAGLCGRPP